MKNQIEVRTVKSSERSMVNESTGEFSGYIAVWGTVDDYDSTFNRGAFAKTISERGNKVKVLYNHKELIGSSVDINEDDYGCRVRGKINMNVRRGKDTVELMKAGDLDGLSFGFITIKDQMVDQIRNIKEVKLYEYGPVDFPANEKAIITEIRSKEIIDLCATECKPESRAIDFDETLSDDELNSKGYKLMSALDRTLLDIWWNFYESGGELSISDFDLAIEKFHASYLEWVNAYANRFVNNEKRSIPGMNGLSVEFEKYRNGRSLEELAQNTSFNIDELKSLQRGGTIAARDKLMPESLRIAHNKIRNTAVSTLFDELRNGLSEVEARRIVSLLRPIDKKPKPADDELLNSVKNFRNQLELENARY